jgi:hypothetical protein
MNFIIVNRYLCECGDNTARWSLPINEIAAIIETTRLGKKRGQIRTKDNQYMITKETFDEVHSLVKESRTNELLTIIEMAQYVISNKTR